MVINSTVLWGLGVFSIIFLWAALLLLPLVLLRLPDDYFIRDPKTLASGALLNPGARWVKNGLGALLLILGVIFLFTPGQGLLTLLAGLVLMEFPGKYDLERRIVRKPGILALVNKIRAKGGKAPFQIEE